MNSPLGRMIEFVVFVTGCWVCTSALFAMVWIVARTLGIASDDEAMLQDAPQERQDAL